MGIESNKEAVAMMQKALKSMEGKIREAYNKGYHDGVTDGIKQTRWEYLSRLIKEAEKYEIEVAEVADDIVKESPNLAKDLVNADCSWK